MSHSHAFIFYFLLAFYPTRSLSVDELTGSHHDGLFDLHADNVLEHILGTNIYQAKLNQIKKHDNFTQRLNNYHDVTVRLVSQVDTIAMNNKSPISPISDNLTQKQIDVKQAFIRTEYILKQMHLGPNLESDGDDLSATTRRFEHAHERAAAGRLEPAHYSRRVSTRRELYDVGDLHNVTYIYKQKIWGLMEQFIYETRYKLPYAQALRKKYKKSFRYRIGYLFALIRNLLYQNRLLYNTYLNNAVSWHSPPSFTWHLRMYEACTRIHSDIKDIVFYIRKLEYQRQMTYDPHYYDSSP